MADLPTYTFPARPTRGVLFGLSAARLAGVAAAGVVLIVVMADPTATSAAVGLALIGLLAGTVTVRVGGRVLVDWLPIAVAFGWRVATGNHEFTSSPEVALDLPDGVLDLPGGLFGLELHTFDPPDAAARARVANPTAVGYGILRDTVRNRTLAIAEVSGAGFLFADPDDQQARIAAWGGVLDQLAHSMPDLARLQLVHAVRPATFGPLARTHDRHGHRGTDTTATSYGQAVAAATDAAQDHRLLLAVAIDDRQARRSIRQAGGGRDAAARVLMDRAATVEDALTGAGIHVHGWLPARTIARLLREAFDPASAPLLDTRPDDVTAGGGLDPGAAGPAGMVDGWTTLRHDSGWSTTLQVVRPPTRPVTGDVLQHLLIAIPATRRLSILYVPTPAAVAERRAQTQQVATESEQTLRARWGFGASARDRQAHQDAATREEELVAGRAVYRVVWLITVTAPSPDALDGAVGQLDAAARRCALEVRRLAGTQQQAFTATLPICRGAR